MTTKGIFLPLGFSCNNNCIHCFLPFADNPVNKSTKEVKKLIRNAAGYGVDRVSLTGGEPTIRKDIFEIVSFCRDLGITDIQLQTNARMLSYEYFCRKLFKCGLNEVFVSIHGHTPEIQDSITQVKGSFEQSVRGIKNLMEMGKKFTGKESIFANLVVSGYNYRHLPEIVRFFSEIGFPLVEIEYPRILGNAQRFSHLIPSRQEAAEFMKAAAETGRNLGVELFIDDFPVCLSKGFYDFNAYVRKGEQEELAFYDNEIKDTEEMEKTQGSKCKGCFARNMCPGEWPENVEKFGWKGFRTLSENEVKSILKFRR
ncbi:MAG: radical SAM protein [Candidatus Aenigmatarchaeota archaeon]|nr:MAG: radical SAM protein [Candidatus Aenigmarchaeota archaeon]